MRIFLTIALILLVQLSYAGTIDKKPSLISPKPKVMLETSMGKIVIELEPDKAPITSQNFLAYVKSGFYEDTIFHRVIKGFMIQGGGFKADMLKKSSDLPIRNEADNGLKNIRGTVAMARTGDPHSASSQFFINTVDNELLNHKGKYMEGWGYAVFGKVVEGMDVVDKISGVQTGTKGSYSDVPIEPVLIRKVVIIK